MLLLSKSQKALKDVNEAHYQGVKLRLLPSNKAQRRLGFCVTNAKLTFLKTAFSVPLRHKNGPKQDGQKAELLGDPHIAMHQII